MNTIHRYTKAVLISALLLPITGAFAATSDSDRNARADETNYNKAPDNSVHNKTKNDLTPASQSNEAADVKLTQEIRRELTRDKQLSTQAENIKIITTRDHQVYLRGVVKNEEEHQKILSSATHLASGRQVIDDLSVTNR